MLLFQARRALGALKGLVKLQALVRGQNVRKQARTTLQYMQALMRVQDRICNKRKSLSHPHARSSVSSTLNVTGRFNQTHYKMITVSVRSICFEIYILILSAVVGLIIHYISV